MRRNVDTKCVACGHELADQVLDEDTVIPCPVCNCPMEQIWWVRSKRSSTCWAEGESVVVFEKPDGTFSFPIRNDKPCPAGWTKHVARNDRELGRLERMTGTLNESRWYDRNGRGFDDYYRGDKMVH